MRALLGMSTKLMLVAVVVTAMSGCGGGERALVTVEYTLQPSKGLPPGLSQVAIAPAELGPATDAKWSDMTADMVQNLIEKSRDKYGTDLRIADRVESKKVFAEADLSAAGLTSDTSGAPARLLGVQAYIVSKIDIKEEVRKGKATTISGLSGFGFRGGGGGSVDTREVEKVKKNVTAQATFKLVDAKTGETWVSHSDSVRSTEETKPSPLFGSGEGESGLTPTDAIAATLIERVAREFVSKLVPCQIEHEIMVDSSSSESCVQGVRNLRADLYSEALASFKVAVASNPGDHQALYGAGVACEALGDFPEALKYYRKALAVKNSSKYADAKDRLSREIEQIQ